MDNEKIKALLKMGYFPVSDDFWAGANLPLFIGGGWDWAYRTPYMDHPFMPYHEETLEKRSLKDSQMFARRNLFKR